MSHDSESRTGHTLEWILAEPANPRAWERFVERYGRRIYVWCRARGLQTADAEDVTQDVLVRLTRYLHTYDRGQGPFRAWLRRVAENAWADHVEQRLKGGQGAGGSGPLDRLQAVPDRRGLGDELEEEYLREMLTIAQARLPVSARDWRVFWALAVEGRPGRAVAEEHGLTAANVYVIKNRVQKALRAELERLEALWQA